MAFCSIKYKISKKIEVNLVIFLHSLLLILVCHPFSAQGAVGVRQIAVYSAERGTDLEVTVWYPAQPNGEQVILGESLFFEGTPSVHNAPVTEGKYPLILLSHGAGLGGNAQALSWIAAPLAAHGFIVAAPTHPGNTGPGRSAAETMKLWLRPADLTLVLDTMLRSTLFKAHLEHEKTGVLGFSMGGNTVLALSGARLSPTRLAGYCDTETLNPSLCGWVKQSGVNLHTLDMREAGRDNLDSRVCFAMVVDPVPVDVFEAKSFSEIQIPVWIVNLGKKGQMPQTADASNVVKIIPRAQYTVIEDASHYSMLGECKPDAVELARKEDIDEPICLDGGERSRSQIHRQLIDMAISAFDRELKVVPLS